MLLCKVNCSKAWIGPFSSGMCLRNATEQTWDISLGGAKNCLETKTLSMVSHADCGVLHTFGSQMDDSLISM